MHVRVFVSMFVHLCLFVSKGVYTVHCRAHFSLLHVCTYIFVCTCKLLSVYDISVCSGVCMSV